MDNSAPAHPYLTGYNSIKVYDNKNIAKCQSLRSDSEFKKQYESQDIENLYKVKK